MGLLVTFHTIISDFNKISKALELQSRNDNAFSVGTDIELPHKPHKIWINFFSVSLILICHGIDKFEMIYCANTSNNHFKMADVLLPLCIISIHSYRNILIVLAKKLICAKTA